MGGYFGEITGDVVLVIFNFAQNVEEEDAHVFLEVLMIQKQLRQKRQILTVNRVLGPIHLEHGHMLFFIPVYLITRRVEQRTRLAVPLQFHFKRVKAEAKFAHVEAVEVVIVDGVGTEVPA